MTQEKLNKPLSENEPGIAQANQYDKILKENMEAALPGLIRHVLHIHAADIEELPDDIQHTKERKPDLLKKMRGKDGETFVLHVEFQVEDESKMVFRMLEYFAMLLRRYDLPIRQYVIYLGAGAPKKMTDHIRSKRLTFSYDLIGLSSVDYRLLLSSGNPEEIVLAILGDFGGQDPKRAIEQIVKQVIKKSDSDFSRAQHLQQLRILAQLRKLAPQTLMIMDSIAKYVSEENDILYRRGEIKGLKKGIEKGIEKGLEKGIQKGKEAFVKYLLQNTDSTIAEIAGLADTTEAFVKKIKATLK